MSDVSVQAVVKPLLDALAPLGWSESDYLFPDFFIGLPLVKQALAARHGGASFTPTAREVLDVIASIDPQAVYEAQKSIIDQGGQPPKPPAPGSPKPPTPTPTPMPGPPKPQYHPLISSEAVAGLPDNFFTPMRIYGQGFAALEAITLYQVLDGAQAPLYPTVSDSSGHMDITIDLNANTHYDVYALGKTSNVPSNTIGFMTA